MSTNKVKVVTGKVRFSFCHVFQPHSGIEGGTPKYSVSIIIPKSDKETVAKLQKAFEDTKQGAAAVFGAGLGWLIEKFLK